MFTRCSWTGLNFWWTLSCSLNLSQILCEHYLVHEILSNFGEHYQWTLSSAEIFIIHELDNEIWAKLHMNIILFMKYLVRRSWTLSCSPNFEISWTAKPATAVDWEVEILDGTCLVGKTNLGSLDVRVRFFAGISGRGAIGPRNSGQAFPNRRCTRCCWRWPQWTTAFRL